MGKKRLNKATRPVTVVYDQAQTNPAAIITAIEKRGDKVAVN